MRRFGTLLSFGLAAVAITAGAVGCQGPISDWPPKAGSGGDGTSVPGGSNPSRPVVTLDAAVGSMVGGPGGVSAGGTAGGATGPLGGLIGAGGTAGGGTTGGGAPTGSADAGAPRPSDAGTSIPSFDAGAFPDTGVADPDAGDGGVGGEGGAEGGCNSVPIDAGVVPGADAGLCAAYGCGITLSTLTAASQPSGECATPEALAFVCSGELTRAALQCTQDNALALSLGRAVSNCMRRLPQLAQVPGDCQQCYVDETLCTLSRCFTACIDGRDPACQQCRQKSCGEAFSKCAGVPAPAQSMF